MRAILLLLVGALLAGCVSDAPEIDEGPTLRPDDASEAPARPQRPAGNDAPEAIATVWGDPLGKGIRPGIVTTYEGAQCTSSFLFQDPAGELYLASAAHCIAGGDNTQTNGCDAPAAPLGSDVTLHLDGGGEATAKLAYSSWRAMQDANETDAEACSGNDFALLWIDPGDHGLAHPAALHFGGPTGLASTSTDTLYGWGASGLKLGLEAVHPKQGLHLGTANDGWSHWVYLATPGIPGDSGGFITTDDGRALGVASTLQIAPVAGSNHYTDISKAIAYAESHTGVPLEIVTWDDWTPSIV